MKTYKLFLLVIVFLGTDLCTAQFGTLDTTFDSDGKVLTVFQGYNSAVHALALQPDNKILAAGAVYNHGTYSQFGLARYNSDGSLDASFGVAGKVVSNFAGLQMDMTSLILQSDGKIIGGGIIYNNYTDSQFILVRYLSNGSLDTSFGINGSVIEDQIIIRDITMQPDGKIIAAGFTLDASANRDLALMRYNQDGTRDADFGLNGKVVTSVGQKDFGNAMTLQPDGKIVVAGSLYTEYSSDFLVARYLSTGVLDTTFGTEGTAVIDHGYNDETSAVRIQPDGKMIFVGYSANESGQANFSIARLMPNGELDPSFGNSGDGLVCGAGAGMAKKIELQADGKIILAGAYQQGGNYNIGLSRYQSNGNIDETFGENGVVTTSMSTTCQANALLLQPDGKIVIGGEAGLTGGSYNPDFALARYMSGSELGIPVSQKPTNAFSVYPNPVNEIVNLDVTLDQSEILSVDLYDTNGRKIKTLLSNKDFSSGYNSQSLELPETLVKGIYFLNIYNSKMHHNIQIAK